MTTTVRPTPSVPGFRGERIAPGDPAYDAARRIWNGAADRHPALIVRPRDAEDVAQAIAAARRPRACRSRSAAAATAWPGTPPATTAS